MTRMVLPGLRPDPIQSYLVALGLLRAVGEQFDPDARLAFGATGATLDSSLTRDDLVEAMITTWSPTPMVAPWNKGSGLRPDGSAKAAEVKLAALRSNTSPRLDDLRETVSAATRVVDDLGLERAAAEKEDLLTACRNQFPDRALEFLDAAAVLTTEGVAYPLLLGTGGNLGRLDLTANVLDHLDRIVGFDEPADTERSTAWLADVLDGTTRASRVKASTGQYEPGAAGGVNASGRDDAFALVNPWGFLLALEGALMFAAAAVRRLGSSVGMAAVPFSVHSTTVGASHLTDDEPVKGDLWLPVWSRPATLPQVRGLFGEGRLTWGRGAARTSVDAARAVATLGAERGVDRFARFVVVERLGQSPIVVQAGTFEAGRTPSASLTLAADPWVGRLRRLANPPTSLVAAIRAYDEATMAQASGRGDTARTTQVVLQRLAEVEHLVRRNQSLRGEFGPLGWLEPNRWLPVLDDGTREYRLAAALASQHDRELPDAWRPGLRWPRSVATARRGIEVEGQWEAPAWSNTALTLSRDPVVGLAEIHAAHANAMPRTTPAAVRDDAGDDAVRAVRGPVGCHTSFTHGSASRIDDLLALMTRSVDEVRLGGLLDALSLLRPFTRWPDATDPTGRGPESRATSPVGALLLVFGGHHVLRLRRHAPSLARHGEVTEIVLLPDRSWPRLLLAGRTDRVVADAHRRLRVAGHPYPTPIVDPGDDGASLAAGLLLHPTRRQLTSHLINLVPEVARPVNLPRLHEEPTHATS